MPRGRVLDATSSGAVAVARAARAARVGAPAGDPAVVRARRDDPLPRAARPRAVLGRRLGNARRLPGPGRAAAGARTVGRRSATCCCASSRARTPTATGRSGSCSSSAIAASAPTTRTATSSSGRCSRSRSTCSRPTTARSSTWWCRSSCRRPTRAPSARRSWAHVERALGVIARRRSPARRSPPTGTATGTTRSSPSTRRCASASAAPGR